MPSEHRPVRRNHLAALGAATVVRAAVAGAQWGQEHRIPTTPPRSPRPQQPPPSPASAAGSAAPAVLEVPAAVSVDPLLIRSVARQVLLEQEQPEHLTNVDLIARDVLSQSPADPAEAERMTRETMLGTAQAPRRELPGDRAGDRPAAVPADRPGLHRCRRQTGVDGRRRPRHRPGSHHHGPARPRDGPRLTTSCGTSVTTTASVRLPDAFPTRTSRSAASRSMRADSAVHTATSLQGTTPPPTSSST